MDVLAVAVLAFGALGWAFLLTAARRAGARGAVGFLVWLLRQIERECHALALTLEVSQQYWRDVRAAERGAR